MSTPAKVTGTIMGWWHLPDKAGIEVVKGKTPLMLPYLREELLLDIQPTRRIRGEGHNAQVSHNAVNSLVAALLQRIADQCGGV